MQVVLMNIFDEGGGGTVGLIMVGEMTAQIMVTLLKLEIVST